MQRLPVLILVIVFALVAGTVPAAAAQPRSKAIGTFGTWAAFTGTESGKRVCYAVGYPKKTEGKFKVRGKAYVIVTLRPAVKPFAVVAVEAGYPYKADSEVRVDIDGKTFSLFTRNRPDGDGDAWARSDDDDKALTVAMKAGKTMLVRGTSSRGTVTTDTYSLTGFGKAMDAVAKACK
jgi:hypothetical protein